ncbi:MAG: SH3 domain-containing protein [Dongiaceae bacterium]
MRKFSAALIVLAASAVAGTASAASISVPAVPAQSAYQTVADTQMVVTHAYANLRDKPSTSGKLLGKLDKGTKVDVLGKAAGGKWLHVKADTKEGYVAANLLK